MLPLASLPFVYVIYALCNLEGIVATACAFVENFFCFALQNCCDFLERVFLTIHCVATQQMLSVCLRL